MAQNQNIGLLAQYVAVNTAANSATFSTSVIAGAISIGNSSVNVSINSTSVSTGSGAALVSPANVSLQYAWTNTQSFSNTITFNGAIVSTNTISANGGVGTAGQVLTSAGAAANVYWAAAAAGTNVAAQYAWTNSQSFSAVVTHTANVSVNGAIIANGGAGTSGQVLTSAAGGNVYWASASGGFTNGQSISVNNFVVSGTVTANGSVGAAGQTLVSNGAGVNWSSLVPSYNYSAQFNGGNYLSTPNSTDLNLAGGSWTGECWLNPNGDYSNYRGVFAKRQQGGGLCSYQTFLDITTGYVCIYNGTVSYKSSTTLTANTWSHVAWVYDGTNINIYVNGARVLQTAASFSEYNTPFFVGLGGSGEYYVGFISNLRITKGVAVYTGAFSVPTSPLQTTQAAGTNIAAITGTQTSLLTCNALTLTDSSPFYHIMTNNSGVVASATSNPPFTYSSVSIPTTSLTSLRQSFTGDGSTTVFNIAGGYTPGTLSVYYNGLMLRNGSDVTATNGATITMAIAPQSGALIDVVGTIATTYSSITQQGYSVGFVAASSQALSIPSFSPVQTGSTPFCIEAWVYNTTFACGVIATNSYGGGASNIPYYIGFSEAGGAGDPAVPGAYLRFGCYTGSAWSTIVSPVSASIGAWYHIAATGDGTTTRLFLNGVLVASSTTLSYVSTASAAGYYIGRRWDLLGSNYFNGYISNFRFVQGAAVYTTPFTPSGPLAAVQASSTGIGAITGTQTKLLTCNAPTIIDGSTNAFTITNNGTATVSTAIVPTFTNVSITSPSTPSMTYGVSSATAITVNTATPTAICSVTITTKGKPVLIVATGDGNPNQASGWHILQIYRDGSAIGKSIINENAGGASCNGPFALTHIDVPVAGSHTYEVRAWQGSGSFLYGESGDSQAPNIAVVELL